MQVGFHRNLLTFLARKAPVFALLMASQMAFAASQTISFSVPATNAATGALAIVGGTGTISAATSSGLVVSFSSSTPGICSVSTGGVSYGYTTGTVTGVSAGTCIIAANQAGDATYSAAPQATLSVTIGASSTSISNARVFAYAEANFPALFAGTPTSGQTTYQGKQYSYQYYPASNNYLAIDNDGMISILGSYTGGVLSTLGSVTKYQTAITDWEATKSGTGTTGSTTSGKGIRPSISWEVSVTPAIYTYVMQLCYGSNQCTALGGTVLMDVNPNDTTFVSGTANGINYGDLTRDELQAAIDAGTAELNTLIANLWTGTTTPNSTVMESVLNTALANATDVADLKSRVISGFTAAGFPAVAGTTATTGGSSTGGTGDASACASEPYLGGDNNPQVDYYCQIAQFDACYHNATGQTTYDADGRNQCTVLDGLLQSTGSTWSCRYCPYPY